MINKVRTHLSQNESLLFEISSPGKKGYPRFQHDNRSVEYKGTGWKRDPDGRHLTCTDGCGIGRVRLVGTRASEPHPLEQIKRVRLLRRADGYYAQFVLQVGRGIQHAPSGSAVGIDVGITLVMAENLRTGFVWDTFMKNPEAQKGMDRAGFKPYAAAFPPQTNPPQTKNT